MDEAALIERVQQGDLDAYERLMDLHVRRLRAYVALNAPAKYLVDEVAHEAFVFAFRRIKEFTPGTSFQAYVRAIAEQVLRAEVQRFSRERANKMKYAERLAVERFQARTAPLASAELEHLESCLSEVPPKLRGLLDLKYKQGTSTTELAQALQQSAAWIRTTLFRLRKQLKECMERKLSAGRT